MQELFEDSIQGTFDAINDSLAKLRKYGYAVPRTAYLIGGFGGCDYVEKG